MLVILTFIATINATKPFKTGPVSAQCECVIYLDVIFWFRIVCE